jgi:hypothetical protein
VSRRSRRRYQWAVDIRLALAFALYVLVALCIYTPFGDIGNPSHLVPVEDTTTTRTTTSEVTP